MLTLLDWGNIMPYLLKAWLGDIGEIGKPLIVVGCASWGLSSITIYLST